MAETTTPSRRPPTAPPASGTSPFHIRPPDGAAPQPPFHLITSCSSVCPAPLPCRFSSQKWWLLSAQICSYFGSFSSAVGVYVCVCVPGTCVSEMWPTPRGTWADGVLAVHGRCTLPESTKMEMKPWAMYYANPHYRKIHAAPASFLRYQCAGNKKTEYTRLARQCKNVKKCKFPVQHQPVLPWYNISHPSSVLVNTQAKIAIRRTNAASLHHIAVIHTLYVRKEDAALEMCRQSAWPKLRCDSDCIKMHQDATRCSKPCKAVATCTKRHRL